MSAQSSASIMPVPQPQVSALPFRLALPNDLTPGLSELVSSLHLSRLVGVRAYNGSKPTHNIPEAEALDLIAAKKASWATYKRGAQTIVDTRSIVSAESSAILSLSPRELKRLSRMPLANFWIEVEKLKLLLKPLSPETMKVIGSRPSLNDAQKEFEASVAPLLDAVQRDRKKIPSRMLPLVLSPLAMLEKRLPKPCESLLGEFIKYHERRCQGLFSYAAGGRLPRMDSRPQPSKHFCVRIHICPVLEKCAVNCGQWTTQDCADRLVAQGCAQWAIHTAGEEVGHSAIRLTQEYRQARGESSAISADFGVKALEYESPFAKPVRPKGHGPDSDNPRGDDYHDVDKGDICTPGYREAQIICDAEATLNLVPKRHRKKTQDKRSSVGRDVSPAEFEEIKAQLDAPARLLP